MDSNQRQAVAKYGSLLSEVRKAADSNDMEAVKRALDSADAHQRDMADLANNTRQETDTNQQPAPGSMRAGTQPNQATRGAQPQGSAANTESGRNR